MFARGTRCLASQLPFAAPGTTQAFPQAQHCTEFRAPLIREARMKITPKLDGLHPVRAGSSAPNYTTYDEICIVVLRHVDPVTRDLPDERNLS